MPCMKPPQPEKVKNLKEESFIREGKGKLKVMIESSGERLETTITGSLKSVSEIAEMLGVEVKEGKIDAVIDGVRIKMKKNKAELEFENGDKMRIEKA